MNTNELPYIGIAGSLGMLLNPLGFLRALAAKGNLVVFRVGHRRALFVNDWESINHMLSNRSGSYAKGLGIEDYSSLFAGGVLAASGAEWATGRRMLGSLMESPQDLPVRQRDLVAQMLAEAASEREARPYRLIFALVLGCLVHDLSGIRLSMPKALCLADDLLIHFRVGIRRIVLKRVLGKLGLGKHVLPPPSLQVRHFINELVQHVQKTNPACCPRTDQLPVLAANVRTLLFAGLETTSALVMSALTLSRNLGDPEPWRLAFLLECLRMMPPVWMIPRRCMKQDTLPNGVVVAPLVHVLISPLCLHSDQTLWEDARAFRPDRFSSIDGVETANSVAGFVPFGLGARKCLGARIAIPATQEILRQLCNKYTLVGHVDVSRFNLGLTLHLDDSQALLASRQSA